MKKYQKLIAVATAITTIGLTAFSPIGIVQAAENPIVIAPRHTEGMGTTVRYNGVHFRANPWETNTNSLGLVHAGQIVSFRGRVGAWTQVRVETGVHSATVGYVHTTMINNNDWIW